jgi:hypothetical protein
VYFVTEITNKAILFANYTVFAKHNYYHSEKGCFKMWSFYGDENMGCGLQSYNTTYFTS